MICIPLFSICAYLFSLWGKFKKLRFFYVFCSCASLIRRMGLQQLITAQRDN